jgi:alpha,alpha-trehalose-phosphate synthase [UDP-forming]/trehalose-phosphatase
MNPISDADGAYWMSLAKHRPLGILTDLDGTLVPFAATPEEARPSSAVSALVDELARSPDTTLVVVSGRPRLTLDEYFAAPSRALLVAEHGAWRRNGAQWEPMVSFEPGVVDSLAQLLAPLEAHTGARVERKTSSVAVHYRKVAEFGKAELLVQAGAIVDAWIRTHPSFEALAGAEVLEVRPRGARKGNAVSWVRGLLGPSCRMLIVGDDVTDEDMFTAAGPEDATVYVGPEPERPTAARWWLATTADVHAFYAWLASLRREAAPVPPSRKPSRVATLPDATGESTFDLLVLSNRLPELRSAGAEPSRKQNVGGLVSALAPALGERRGIWLGWSGRSRPDATATELGFSKIGGLALAWVDFPEHWHRHYYNGLSNSALWPLMHTFPTRMKIAHEDWRAYQAANDAFAALACRLVRPDATIWAHDYHLLLFGQHMRARGHTGRIGLFQHVPFPGPDVLCLLPWAREILEALLDLDLIGFHTARYRDNFLACAATLPGVRVEGQRAMRDGKAVLAGVFPIGIIAEDFQEVAATPDDEIAGLMRSIHHAKLVLGVDRLDYTKGIPERLEAFGRFLEFYPAWRKKVCLVQVSVPSRGDIPEYVEQRSRVENTVGRINGERGEADWVPIRYLYRSYGRAQLSALYRAAAVGYVTPLRDGMNLVAKEYVAAQSPEAPGVLLLSRFAGAADELDAAVLTNPWDAEGMAHDLERALSMPLDERVSRHRRLFEVISRTTAVTWAAGFLAALADTRPG